DHAAAASTGYLDLLSDRDPSRRRLHVALPPDRLDVVRADLRVIRQADEERPDGARLDLLRRRQRVGARHLATGGVEAIDLDVAAVAGARARVHNRPFNEDGGAVGAAALLDGADAELGGARFRQRSFGERRGRRGRGRRGRGLLGAAGEEHHAREERREAPAPQVAISAALPARTASPRSVFATSTTFPGAICHMSAVIVSPGNTTPEKRTSKALRRAGSFPQ